MLAMRRWQTMPLKPKQPGAEEQADVLGQSNVRRNQARQVNFTTCRQRHPAGRAGRPCMDSTWSSTRCLHLHSWTFSIVTTWESPAVIPRHPGAPQSVQSW